MIWTPHKTVMALDDMKRYHKGIWYRPYCIAAGYAWIMHTTDDCMEIFDLHEEKYGAPKRSD